MDYYEVDGMTACRETNVWGCDENIYWCYMTINGVDVDSACPDEWTDYESDCTEQEEEYDCMDYYEVDGMTACREVNTWDSCDYDEYLCYMTINGVDVDSDCPDEWSDYESDQDRYSDDEDWYTDDDNMSEDE